MANYNNKCIIAAFPNHGIALLGKLRHISPKLHIVQDKYFDRVLRQFSFNNVERNIPIKQIVIHDDTVYFLGKICVGTHGEFSDSDSPSGDCGDCGDCGDSSVTWKDYSLISFGPCLITQATWIQRICHKLGI
jgi:hypothetical protein